MNKSIATSLVTALFVLFIFTNCEEDNPADPTATCSDGIQNQDETGIDWGGSCSDCIDDNTALFIGKWKAVKTEAYENNTLVFTSNYAWGFDFTDQANCDNGNSTANYYEYVWIELTNIGWSDHGIDSTTYSPVCDGEIVEKIYEYHEGTWVLEDSPQSINFTENAFSPNIYENNGDITDLNSPITYEPFEVVSVSETDLILKRLEADGDDLDFEIYYYEKF